VLFKLFQALVSKRISEKLKRAENAIYGGESGAQSTGIYKIVRMAKSFIDGIT
jgi:hypothetical protein